MSDSQERRASVAHGQSENVAIENEAQQDVTQVLGSYRTYLLILLIALAATIVAMIYTAAVPLSLLGVSNYSFDMSPVNMANYRPDDVAVNGMIYGLLVDESGNVRLEERDASSMLAPVSAAIVAEAEKDERSRLAQLAELRGQFARTRGGDEFAIIPPAGIAFAEG